MQFFGFSIQIGFNPNLKYKTTRSKTAISFLEKETPNLGHGKEQKFDDLQIKDENWGSDEIMESYDTHDKDIYDREVEHSGSGSVTSLLSENRD